MPEDPLPLTPLLVMTNFVVLGFLGAMISAWVWAIRRLRRGEPLLPSPMFRVVPWGAGSILVLLLAWFLTQNTVVFVHYKATGRLGVVESVEEPAAPAAPRASLDPDKPKPPPWTPFDQLLINAIVVTLLIPQVYLIVRRNANARPADLGLTGRDLGANITRGLVACLLVAPVCYGLNLILSRIWTPQEHLLITTVREQFTGNTALLAVLSAVVLAPLAEELTFRGLLLPWMERLIAGLSAPAGPEPEEMPGAASTEAIAEREAPSSSIMIPAEKAPDIPGPGERTVGRNVLWQANVVTSVIFALLHAKQWPAPVALFVLSMVLGTLVQRTGSLWGPIVLHASFNGLSTGALFLALTLGIKPAEEAVPAPAADPAVEARRLMGDEQQRSYVFHGNALGPVSPRWYVHGPLGVVGEAVSAASLPGHGSPP